jgi:cytochrome c oxidase assembly protein subunit 15
MGETTTHAQTRRQNAATPGFTLLLSLSTLLVFMLILLSAYLRLANSGLGCSDWPACYALLGTGHGTQAAIPGWATLAHRLTASTLGLFILGMSVIAVQRRRQPGQSVGIPLLLLGLTVFLALLGYKTPAQLLPWVTLGNLLGGMGMLALLWWLGAASTPLSGRAYRRLRPWAVLGLVVVSLQIALGAWNSANFAALACPSLLDCGDVRVSLAGIGEAFNPARQLAAGTDGRVLMDASTKLIHLGHRLGALLAFVYLGWLGWRALRAGPGVRTIGVVLLGLLLLQMTLGMLAVVLALPLPLVLLHNGTAALLLLSVVTLMRRLTLPSG